jgi:hypothetical protein
MAAFRSSVRTRESPEIPMVGSNHRRPEQCFCFRLRYFFLFCHSVSLPPSVHA